MSHFRGAVQSLVCAIRDATPLPQSRLKANWAVHWRSTKGEDANRSESDSGRAVGNGVVFCGNLSQKGRFLRDGGRDPVRPRNSRKRPSFLIPTTQKVAEPRVSSDAQIMNSA